MNREWFYLKNKKGYGPVSWERILELYQGNKLTDNSKVWSNNFSNWVELSEVIKNRESKYKSIPPPLPSQKAEPPPIPETSKSPPPLPRKEEKDIKVGPIQSKEDLIASKLLTKVSFVVLSLLLMGSLYALISGGYQSKEEVFKNISQKWPSAFNLDKNEYSYLPETPVLSQAMFEDINTAVGFRIGQEISINELSEKFPSLSRDLLLAKIKFDSEYGPSFKKMDEKLSKELDDWSRRKENARKAIRDNLNFSTISLENAEFFLTKVKDRINGNLPSPILETVLMFDPKYIKTPRLMFSDGFTKEYKSENSAKSKGINVAIQYPASWKAEEGRRPNVVQNFTSENGNGLEMAILVIKRLPEEITGQVKAEDILLLEGENIWNQVYPNISINDNGNVTIANKPSIWGEFSGSINQAGIKIETQGLGFAMIENKTMVKILFMVSKPEKEKGYKIESKFNHTAQIFQMMVNSLDFYDKYK